MSNYYTKREAKVNIANELAKRGWKIFGYKEDESDSMTDYYSPSNWDGIATKNGFTLVIDTTGNNLDGTRKKERWNNNFVSMEVKDQKKIELLKNMTLENGAASGEVENAQNMIEKIKAKYENIENNNRYETVEIYPKYQGNKKGSIWHIEKDGVLIDKGNKLTVFADIPASYVFDIDTMEFKESYKYYCGWKYNEETGYNEKVEELRTLTEGEEKAVKEFKKFLARLEKAVITLDNVCGDGTEETTREGLKQQAENQLIKVIKTVTKNITELEEVEGKKELKVNDIVKYNGYYYMVEDTNENKYSFYSCVKLGSKSRGYKKSKSLLNGFINLTKISWDKAISNNRIKVYNLVEKTITENVEKWERVKKSNTSKKTTTTEKKEEIKEDIKQNENITITFNEEKKGIEIQFSEKPSNEVINQLKENGFRYYHKLNKKWIAKDTEERREFLNTLQGEKTESITVDENIINDDDIEKNNNTYEEVKENKIIIDSEIIEHNYNYNCHFKLWNLEENEVIEKLNNLQIPKEKYYIVGEKFIFNNLSFDEVITVKAINDINKSMFFIDEKIAIEEVKNVEEANEPIQEEQKEEGQTMDINNILNMFDNVEINNNSRLSIEDQKVINDYENKLNDMQGQFKKYLEFFRENTIINVEGKEVKRSIYSLEDDFIKEVVFKECDDFIREIYYYFMDKYNIKLKVLEHDKDYYKQGRQLRAEKNLDWYMNELTVELMVNDIFDQLQGETLENKGIKEIKETFYNKVKYNNPAPKGKNINLKSYIRFDSLWNGYKLRYNYEDDFKNLLRAISLYEYKNMDDYNGLYKAIKDEENIINTYELGEKITSLTISKNGSIKLTFKNSIYALDFAKELLKYSESAA